MPVLNLSNEQAYATPIYINVYTVYIYIYPCPSRMYPIYETTAFREAGTSLCHALRKRSRSI